jgi:hypothetical protein
MSYKPLLGPRILQDALSMSAESSTHNLTVYSRDLSWVILFAGIQVVFLSGQEV